MKRVSFLLYLGAAALTIVVVYSIYVFWQKSAGADQVTMVDKSIVDYQAKVLDKEFLQVTAAVNAKKTLNDLKNSTIKWSKVIDQIRGTIPKDGMTPLAQILSYSGSSTNDISLNMKTVSGRDTPYLDVAAIIKSFSDSKVFNDAFVPSISSATDETGKTILSFTLSAKYVAPSDEPVLKTTPDKLNDSVSDVLKNSLEDKKTPVSR
ncbi:hypothetical protein HZA40_00430 [Candidatus Peregrinibacteria bacterium]|nr:hypothetical protein [Candidatus Peregrinibacteria bacterium]